MFKRTLTTPWLHFLLLGILLYSGQQWLQAPELPTVTAPDDMRMAQLRGEWLRASGRPPSPKQLQQIIASEVDSEILFREALARDWHLSDSVVRQRLLKNMRFLDVETELDDGQLFRAALDLGMHESDLVVRRRLIQRMELAVYADIRRSDPGDEALQQLYRDDLALAEQALYRQSPRVAIEHRFFSRDRDGEPEQRARTALASLQAEPESAAGDPFLHGLNFNLLSEGQLGRYFGADFGRALMAQATQQEQPQPGQWLGPIASSYGWHLVQVTQYQAAKARQFTEVRSQLLAAWRRQQERLARAQLLEQLRNQYRVLAADVIEVAG